MSLQERLNARPTRLTKLDLFDAFIANLPDGEKAAAFTMLHDPIGYPAGYVVESFEQNGFSLTFKNVWDWRKAHNVSR